MSIHRSAENFDGAAEVYERARPGYRREAVDEIARILGLGPGRTVVDLAAGTGKFTRELVATGVEVIAVEPVAGMREQLRSVLSHVDVRDGTAEAMPVADESADAVTVAQAFHWFDGDAALAEIHRVLRPGGRLLLVWNRRDLRDAMQRAVFDLIETYRCDTPSHRSLVWREALTRTSLFGPLHDLELPGIVQVLDGDGVADRVASISMIAGLPDEEREQVRSQARHLLDGVGRYPFPHVTDVHWCERRS